LFVKDVANRLHPICVPNVFEQGRSIIQYLEAFTGLKCIAIQTPREHKQWRSEKVTMKDNASIEDSSKRNEAVNSVVERVDFSELSRRAFSEDGTREDKRKLWQATFALKEWYYLARGSLENPTPYCATAVQIEPDTYWLYAFTDPDRVEQFAHQLQGENAPFVYLTVPNPADRGAIARIMSYQEDGIKGIYFNCLDYGFYAPLSDLQALADAVMSRTSDSG
jgi:hypothetical protein